MQNIENKKLALWAIVVCGAIFALILLDIAGDYQDGLSLQHILIEGLILISSCAGTVYFGWLYYQETQLTINRLQVDLAVASQQAAHWREANKDLIAGLSKQIAKQFEQWSLSHAEVEVGMLMLKGLSHQEIADIRDTSERTIREQARAIYRKSGLAGRSELSAFFLEDLLPPHM